MVTIRVRQDGSVCIPAAERARFGIVPGGLLEYHMNAHNQVVLTPKTYYCSVCRGEFKVLDRVTGLCPACQHEFARLIRQGMEVSAALKEMRKTRR